MGAIIEDPSSIIKGTKAAVIAFDNGNQIEVWDEEGERQLGALPRGTSALFIDAAANFFDNGERDGYNQGFRAAQVKMQEALGFKN